jgi:hypothetical protein
VTTTTNDERTLNQARLARDWPKISDLASEYGLNPRSIRKAVDAGQVIAFRLNVTRVDPVSFAAWLAARQK